MSILKYISYKTNILKVAKYQYFIKSKIIIYNVLVFQKETGTRKRKRLRGD